MAQPYVGEIRIFAGNFEPAGWMYCQGQLLPISENEVLFQLIGTTYGGDGQNTFGLPDLRGRVPIHVGDGRTMAEAGGVETVTLTTNQMPAHNHAALAGPVGNKAIPAGNYWAADPAAGVAEYTSAPGNLGESMNPAMVVAAGGSQPHDNLQPYLAINYIISLFGIFPSQS